VVEEDPNGPATAAGSRRAATRRDQKADKREAALDEREDRVEAEESTGAGRSDVVQGILNEADVRDANADARDSAAQRRDMAATLEEYLNQETNTEGIKARGASALDRSHSRGDRVASKDDRSHLADEATGTSAGHADPDSDD
jgi:hypothetical protein